MIGDEDNFDIKFEKLKIKEHLNKGIKEEPPSNSTLTLSAIEFELVSVTEAEDPENAVHPFEDKLFPSKLSVKLRPLHK